MDYDLLNGGNLAYIGDAYFTLRIREYLLGKGITEMNRLQKMSVEYVSAKAQENVVLKLLPNLTEEETLVYKRGRNYKTRAARKIDIKDHNISSGFEALIGYLYLSKQNERLEEIIRLTIRVVEEKNEWVSLWKEFSPWDFKIWT